MREPTIAKNYAEALLALATKARDIEGWGRTLDAIADAMGRDVQLRRFLESPRVDAAKKNEILGKAFADKLPPVFVKYLQAVVRRRRQMVIPAIAIEYRLLVDQVVGRVHANVTIARDADDAERAMIAKRLSDVLGKDVVPHMTVDPGIIGGIVVRVGDRVMDGSVRRRLANLRQRMLYGAR